MLHSHFSAEKNFQSSSAFVVAVGVVVVADDGNP
jgi:hypothetical protein